MKPLSAAFTLVFRRYRSLTVLIVILVASLVSAFATGFWLPSRLAYVIAAAIPLCYLWARVNMWGVSAEAERRVDRLEQGQAFEERLFVRNRNFLGKLWLEVDDPSDLPGHVAGRVLGLRRGETRSWKVTTRCERRGVFTLGPVTVSSGDPFGVFRLTRSFGHSRSILVYPKALDLTSFYLPPAQLTGEKRLRRATHHVTPNAAGIRAYEFGDSFSRIHWPSTARTGDLMVKLFEMDPASDVWLVLDMEKKAHAGKGEQSTEEYVIRIAASVARYFFRANRSVGLIAFDGKLTVIEPERGLHHHVRILESLAVMKAAGDVPLAELLPKEGKRFGRQTTVLTITPSAQEDWVAVLKAMGERGGRLACVLLEASTFGDAPDSLVVFGALAAADIHTFMIKRSDDLLTALTSGSETGGRMSAGVGNARSQR
ncbi:MAG: DUF58 domain-containing protein [Dehalococcoidia bacterium]|nr:DUF58 domain-containing protein [Dehalococcoidia bacterium]